MRSFKAGQPWLYVLAVLFLIVGAGGLAEAKTLNVANNGVDSATCGDKNSPCRSISQAIQNASAGDKIIVGPGRYGDLDNDGTFGETGEEDAEVGSGCKCMIKVNNRLTIESRDGAAATVLDAGGAEVDVVRIEASGVVFGKKKKGFTLTHAGFNGLFIADSTTGVRVTGNLATATGGTGFEFFGSGHVLTNNLASANGTTGFSFSGSGHLLTGNLASANGEDGFGFSGSGHVLTGNLASANGFEGFNFSGSGHVLSDNIASANRFDGFNFSGSGHVLSGNGALGNGRFGIVVGTSATITKNNIFGNATHMALGASINCGLSNASGGAINATNNFWGTADGPGTLAMPHPEPADNVCDAPGSTTNFSGFATKEFMGKSQSVLFLQESTPLAPAASGGRTLFVANNGLDVLSMGFCGDKDHPCRSISKAIANASAGDKIVVGPGRYGDLNADGKFDDPGDEAAEVGTGCSCMIRVNRQLTIESRDGAGATVLDAGGINVNVVRIEASGVVFGKKNKGFTLTGAGGFLSGLVIVNGTSGVKVGGNLATRNSSNGFSFTGSGHQLSGNLATANEGTGFFFGGSGHVLTSNIASTNGDHGFFIAGSGHVLTGNLASANGSNGFVIAGSEDVLRGNVANANKISGFFVVSGIGHVLNGNAAVGNKIFGFSVGSSATISQNNIYGNNSEPDPFTGQDLTNCGLLNFTGGSITATDNFWGATTGPGADPADNVCNFGINSSTTFTPFVSKEFKFKTLSPVEEPGEVEPADSMEGATLPAQLLRATQTKEGLLFHALGEVSALRLEVTDLSGRKIYDSGFVKGHALRWTRVNVQNRLIASGVYLYRLTARDREGREVRSELRKLIILK